MFSLTTMWIMAEVVLRGREAISVWLSSSQFLGMLQSMGKIAQQSSNNSPCCFDSYRCLKVDCNRFWNFQLRQSKWTWNNFAESHTSISSILGRIGLNEQESFGDPGLRSFPRSFDFFKFCCIATKRWTSNSMTNFSSTLERFPGESWFWLRSTGSRSNSRLLTFFRRSVAGCWD